MAYNNFRLLDLPVKVRKKAEKLEVGQTTECEYAGKLFTLKRVRNYEKKKQISTKDN